MFKQLRYLVVGVVLVAFGAVAYHFVGNPELRRQVAEKATELNEDWRNPKTPKWSGTVLVTEAPEGDQLLVKMDSGQTKVRVCLAGIDAPELSKGPQAGQPFSEESRAYLAQLTTNRTAEMKIVGTDSAKRPCVLLTIDGVLINARMVEAGLAEAFSEEPFELPLKVRHQIANAELAARKNQSGIWSLTNYMRPIEYRMRHK